MRIIKTRVNWQHLNIAVLLLTITETTASIYSLPQREYLSAISGTQGGYKQPASHRMAQLLNVVSLAELVRQVDHITWT